MSRSLNLSTDTSGGYLASVGRFLPALPLVIWMILFTLVIGIWAGKSPKDLVQVFNVGWGRALGEFALILLPSFTLAAVLSKLTGGDRSSDARTGKGAGKVSGAAVLLSPFASAAMVCPDTAYAALSPLSGKHKLGTTFGAYAGFKLLFPAGPLIVATGLGVSDDSLLYYGLLLIIPIWMVGWGWAKLFSSGEGLQTLISEKKDGAEGGRQSTLPLFLPFAVMIGLLGLGLLTEGSLGYALDMLVQPKGALISTAILVLFLIPAGQRQGCLESAVRRTGSLLLVIGAASAFGAMLTNVLPVGDFIAIETGLLGIIGLFLLSVLFKLIQGSSMATFAAVAPVAAPLLAGTDISGVAAVYAICLGSFVAILPNDSYYWLVRKDALETMWEGRSILLLSGGACLQALVGMVILLALYSMGV